MFVLLEHAVECPRPDVHWDFMVRIPGRRRLPTWRLAHDPTAHSGAIRAERIGDHRPAFLDYEGEISGGRGRVCRRDRGDAVVERFTASTLVVRLTGDLLRGTYEIAGEGPSGAFRRLDRS